MCGESWALKSVPYRNYSHRAHTDGATWSLFSHLMGLLSFRGERGRQGASPAISLRSLHRDSDWWVTTWLRVDLEGAETAFSHFTGRVTLRHSLPAADFVASSPQRHHIDIADCNGSLHQVSSRKRPLRGQSGMHPPAPKIPLLLIP